MPFRRKVPRRGRPAKRAVLVVGMTAQAALKSPVLLVADHPALDRARDQVVAAAALATNCRLLNLPDTGGPYRQRRCFFLQEFRALPRCFGQFSVAGNAIGTEVRLTGQYYVGSNPY